MTMVRSSPHLLPLSGVLHDGLIAGMLVVEELASCEPALNYTKMDKQKPCIAAPQRTKVAMQNIAAPTARLRLRKRMRKMMSWMRWTVNYLGLGVMTTIRERVKGRR